MTEISSNILHGKANANFSAARNFMYLTVAMTAISIGVHENPLLIKLATSGLALSIFGMGYNAVRGNRRRKAAYKAADLGY